MALHTGHGRPIISMPLPVLSPAKTPSFTIPTQRTLCFIPRRIHSKSLSFTSKSTLLYTLRATLSPQKYVYPDPIPEFAEAETRKFRTELWDKLLKEEETFGDNLDNVVEVCAEIFGEFLHKEYGGPGTLLVEPFTDMLLALKERKLPGAPLAARASLLWAQNYIDQDWEVWNSTPSK